tara:strand:+ start:3750 stop:3980 length:231 start_codon:yes stop_codon:yes gene_type:complete
MKKLFLSIATLSLMSFTSIEIYQNYVLGESITTIQDMKEWMTQDIESGNINPELGQTYIDNLEQVENDLIKYVNNK